MTYAQVMRDAGLTPLVDYPGNNTPWLCKCDVCGREVTPCYSSVARGRGGCSPCRFDKQKGFKGAAHPLYKGDDVGYAAAHRRVRQQRGPAADHLCVDCGSTANEWSYVGGCPNEKWGPMKSGGTVMPYSLDKDRYAPRCVTCHRRRDLGKRAVSLLGS